jgi:hypothetical protein
MLWPGNSPDLNAIEPVWFWLKQRTTAQGATTDREELKRRWYKAWQDIPQSVLQHFVERIPSHIQEIIGQTGGNEYMEKTPGYKRSWKGDRLKGKLSTHAYLDPDRAAGKPTPTVPQMKLPNAVERPHSEETQHKGFKHDEEVSDDEDDWLWASDAEEEYDRRENTRRRRKKGV